MGFRRPLRSHMTAHTRLSAALYTVFSYRLVTEQRRCRHIVSKSATLHPTPPLPCRRNEEDRRTAHPPLPVMVRNHLIKTPESSLRQKSSRNPGADPLAVQENFLAQQRKLQEKIQPSPASGRHRLKNRREDRGLLTRTSTLPYLPR
jgi:hypothetical protein